MTEQKETATAATVADKNVLQTRAYHSEPQRQARIAERRAQIPKLYRGIYDRAVKGKSLRAAINAFCLECVCWQREEIRQCTDLACPLFAVRPYQSSQNGRNEGFSGVESKNSGQ